MSPLGTSGDFLGSSGFPQSFSQMEKDAVYRVIRERRDIRKFRPDPIPQELIQKILAAAAHAPSVGFMQPWNFILIDDQNVRKRIHSAFVQANEEAKKMFEGDRAQQYTSLKLEGILESALNILVTCDRSRFGPVVLGRTCQPEMDLFSTVCAVQNLWLAARAEGIGVGWVSIIKPENLKQIMELPESVSPIAYLCVGYTPKFAVEPELKTQGWLPEIPLPDLIFHNVWGKKFEFS